MEPTTDNWIPEPLYGVQPAMQIVELEASLSLLKGAGLY